MLGRALFNKAYGETYHEASRLDAVSPKCHKANWTIFLVCNKPNRTITAVGMEDVISCACFVFAFPFNKNGVFSSFSNL